MRKHDPTTLYMSEMFLDGSLSVPYEASETPPKHGCACKRDGDCAYHDPCLACRLRPHWGG